MTFHQHHNNAKTAVLLTVLGALIVTVGGLLDGRMGLMLAVLIALGTNVFAFYSCDRLALRAMRAQPLSEPQAPGLYRVVRELATSARQPMPRLYISPTESPNAFATGRNPEHAAVAVTAGILEVLSWDELRGVLAHERLAEPHADRDGHHGARVRPGRARPARPGGLGRAFARPPAGEARIELACVNRAP